MQGTLFVTETFQHFLSVSVEDDMRKLLSFFAIIGLVAMFQTSTASAGSTTDQVWQHHIDAWVARDMDAIVSDYPEDALLIVNNRILRGPEGARKMFTHLFKLFDNGKNRIDPAIVDGRIIYITWHFTPKGGEETYGTDTFVVENGKIMVQTIASQLYDKYPIPE